MVESVKTTLNKSKVSIGERIIMLYFQVAESSNPSTKRGKTYPVDAFDVKSRCLFSRTDLVEFWSSTGSLYFQGLDGLEIVRGMTSRLHTSNYSHELKCFLIINSPTSVR